MRFPKEATVRSRSYLDFIRARPCAWCREHPPSEAHHWHEVEGGMGLKCSDVWTVPLCRACHQRFHDTGSLTTACEDGSRRAREFFRDRQRELLGLYVQSLEF